MEETADTWPPEFVAEVGDERPDFVVRTRRSTCRRDAHRTLKVAALSFVLGLLPFGIFFGGPLMGENILAEVEGEEREIGRDNIGELKGLLLVVLIFQLPAIGFTVLGLLHRFRDGAWVASTPSRFIVVRGEKVTAARWENLSPVVTVRHQGEHGTVSIAEGRAGSVAAMLRRPGIQIPDVRAPERYARVVRARFAGPVGSRDPRPPGHLPVATEPPAYVRDTIRGERTHFIAKAHREGIADVWARGTIVDVGFILIGLLIITLVALTYAGVLTATTGDGDSARPVERGSSDQFFLGLAGLLFVVLGGIDLYRRLVRPLRSGPWTAATDRGLYVMTPTRTQWYGWRSFEPGVRRRGLARKALALQLREGIGGANTETDGYGGRRPDSPDTQVILVGLEQADHIATVLEARLRAVAPDPSAVAG